MHSAHLCVVHDSTRMPHEEEWARHRIAALHSSLARGKCSTSRSCKRWAQWFRPPRPPPREAGCGVTVGEGEPFQVLQRSAGRLLRTMRSSWHPLARYFCDELCIVDIYA
jgi:hypothetical protein